LVSWHIEAVSPLKNMQRSPNHFSKSWNLIRSFIPFIKMSGDRTHRTIEDIDETVLPTFSIFNQT
ncbi:MAG: hypothetical protein ACK6BS_21565, partial [Pseudanabaena sp.]